MNHKKPTPVITFIIRLTVVVLILVTVSVILTVAGA